MPWTGQGHAAAVILGPGSTDPAAHVDAAAAAAVELQLTDGDLAALARPPPATIGAQSSPGVYVDERDAAHPVGATLAPWRNIAHLALPEPEPLGPALDTAGLSPEWAAACAELADTCNRGGDGGVREAAALECLGRLP